MNHTSTINVWKENNRISHLWDVLLADYVSPDPVAGEYLSSGVDLEPAFPLETWETAGKPFTTRGEQNPSPVLETARRTAAAPVVSPRGALDALVLVHAGTSADDVAARFKALLAWLAPGRVHLLGWGNGRKPAQPVPRAWIAPYAPLAQGRTPLSSVFPEHPAARTCEGLVQSLLAGHGRRGGPHA